MIDSLRDFLDAVQKLGDVKTVENADWDLEIGALTEWAGFNPQAPLLLFDSIKGYPQGFRVASNLFTSEPRTAIALGLPPELRGVELVKTLREKLRGGVKLLPPIEVKKGPILENVMKGDEVDLLKFPTPKWHELDGGRYIGTGSMLITRDPEEGWVNLGAYRHQLHDKNTLGIHITPGHHGGVMARKYWAKGQACPAVVVCGQDPSVWNASTQLLPWGVGEYDYAGGYKGKPVEVVRGITTGLPIPATAELAIEGEIPPPEVEKRMEGPFGEAAGYYGPSLPRPVLRVKSVLYRNDPIIQGNPALMSFAGLAVGLHLYKSAQLWDLLDQQMPGVKGVWLIHETTPRGLMVISLKQEYPGQAKQAALAAAGCLPTAYGFKYICVVDDDIDPSNMAEVLWAMVTRTEPERSIDIVRECWGANVNPMLTPEQLANGQTEHSTALIIACKPFHQLQTFPPVNRFSPEVMARFQKKWPGLF